MAKNLAKELSTIDFESMIGGPLVAIINAQAQAAISSVDFIKQVGFKAGEPPEVPTGGTDVVPLPHTNLPPTGDPVLVKFTYNRELPPDEPGGPPTTEKVLLEVPFLTLMPIPFIRIEEATIDFNAKITSVETVNTDTTISLTADMQGRARLGLWGTARLKVGFSTKSRIKTGSEVNRSYSMAVHIRAVQDEMPAGMERMLGILENSIQTKPLEAGTATATTDTPDAAEN